MREAAALDAQDVLILCFQSYVVKTPQSAAVFAHAAGSDWCYAVGGTEIFTDGRSSIFWWKASSLG